jgi:hypothetical protein
MSQRRSVSSALVVEASLAMAYETWIGPTYLSTWAGTLGISREHLPWLTALPALGSLGQIAGVLLFIRVARNVSLKHLCLTLTLLARALWLIPLVAALTGGFADGGPEAWVGRIGILAALSSAIGLTSTSFWMSWMRDLIPHEEEGRFWGGRSHWATIGVVSAHLLSAAWLQWNPGASGFSMLLLLALLSAAGSLWLLTRIPAVPHAIHRPPSGQAFRKLLQPEFRELLVFAALLQGAMFLAGPYFPYYFTHEVGLSGSTVAFWSLMTQAGVWASSAFWGRRMDAHGGVAFHLAGRPVSILRLGTILMALSPLPYVIANPAVLRWIGPVEYFINGVAWAGYTIALNTIIFQRTRSSAFMSMVLFSSLTALQGILGAGASWLGSGIIGSVAQGGFATLWVVAAGARLLIVLFFIPRSMLHGSSRLSAATLPRSPVPHSTIS